MYLSNLRLINFKSYAEATVEWSAGFNVLTGPNGSGKTNLLDAIYWLSTGRSRFHRKDVFSIRIGMSEAALTGTVVDSDGLSGRYHIGLSQQKKVFRVDGRTIPSVREYLGRIPLVLITPIDQELIVGSREIRRRYFDMLFSKAADEYLVDVVRYHRLLRQRNQILKDYSVEAELVPLLEVIDYMLAPLMERIRSYRKAAVAALLPHLMHIHQVLSHSAETPTVIYHPSVPWKTSSAEALRTQRHHDMRYQTTTIGPHRDHYAFLLNEQPIEMASQGQQKTLLLALKLAEWKYLSQVRQTVPLLLLDDLFDKLDSQRSDRLLQLLKDFGPMQVLITDTSVERCQALLGKGPSYFRVCRRADTSIVELI